MAKRDRRAEIMQAAEKLFTSRRFHEITLDDVVQEARVGKGTIYRYFQNKDDLFIQTATSGFDELCDLLAKKVPGNALFTQQLLGACRHISTFFSTRRQLFRIMQSEDARMYWCRGAMRQRWVEHRKRLASAVAGIVRKGVREGKIRADVPVEILASFLLGMLRTRARELADVPESSRSLDLVVDLFCQGAGKPGRGAGRPSAAIVPGRFAADSR
jgi:AcrR family transcriptional regulator